LGKNKQIYIYLESRRLKITYDLLHIFNYTFGQKTSFMLYQLNITGSMEGVRGRLENFCDGCNVGKFQFSIFDCRNVNLRLCKLPKNISINYKANRHF